MKPRTDLRTPRIFLVVLMLMTLQFGLHGSVAAESGHRIDEQVSVGDEIEHVASEGAVGEQTSAAAGSDFAGFAANPAGGGYWVVSKDGGVITSGVSYLGGMNNSVLNGNIIGIAATADGNGYWLVGSDGGIFSFGNAAFYGSMGGQPLNRPIIGIAATTTSKGYWLFASDGGIFSFGDATFHGSTGGMRLNAPVVGMTPTRHGNGYWLVGSDGGVFAFDAQFYGSMGGAHLNSPIVGTLRSSTGAGYWQVGADGGVFSFGDAQFYGSLGNRGSSSPTIGIASRSNSEPGYVLVRQDGSRGEFGPGLNPASLPDDACAKPYMVPPADHSSYSFSRTFANGSPHRFSSCRIVRWQISSSNAPAGAEELLKLAFAKTEAATGIDFEFAGWTSETVDTRVSNTANYRDGGLWKPILVDFGLQPQNSSMCGSAGCGYMYTINGQIVSGALIMNKSLPMAWGEPNGLGEVAIHEIGHVVGLGHISDSDQVMYPYASTLTEYHSGDLRGLWYVGIGSAALAPINP